MPDSRPRIVESDIWDVDDLDLVDPTTILFEVDGHGEFQACMDFEYALTFVFFRWAGCDESDEVTGSGSAELNDDGALENELSFDNDDDRVLTARRE